MKIVKINGDAPVFMYHYKKKLSEVLESFISKRLLDSLIQVYGINNIRNIKGYLYESDGYICSMEGTVADRIIRALEYGDGSIPAYHILTRAEREMRMEDARQAS